MYYFIDKVKKSIFAVHTTSAMYLSVRLMFWHVSMAGNMR